jgi:hypothetical protein
VRGKALAIAAMLALTALPAMKATPVLWLANAFAFTDGSSLVGGTVYDAATNTYSSNLLYALGGTDYNNVAFNYWNPSLPVTPDFIALVAGLPTNDLTGVASLWIVPDSAITGPVGSLVLSHVAIEALCSDATCSTVDQTTLALASYGELYGFPATSLVPEPTTALMLPAAFLLFAGWNTFRRRQGRTLS